MNWIRIAGIVIAVGVGAWGWLRTPKPAPSREVIVISPPKTQAVVADDSPERAARLERIRALNLNRYVLRDFIACYRDATQESLIVDGMLQAELPSKGSKALTTQRTASGEELLRTAKDVLYALLFGD